MSGFPRDVLRRDAAHRNRLVPLPGEAQEA